MSNVFSMHDINMWMYKSWMNEFCIISIIKLWNVKFVMQFKKYKSLLHWLTLWKQRVNEFWWTSKYCYVSWLMDYHNMIRVLHLNSITLFKWPSTINVTNFAIPSFTWINMYDMIYWTWNLFIFLMSFCFMVYDIITIWCEYCFFFMFWYGNAIPLQVSKDMLQKPKDFWILYKGYYMFIEYSLP